jgi:glutamyl-tRNA(Gln) amidotransferase subunit E
MIIPKFAGLLKRQCGDRTFGKELNAYAQAYGYGIIHSDEDLSKYNLVSEFHEIKKLFGAEDEDLIIISVGKNPEQALQKISERCNECMAGVPEETRVSDDIGSKYTRPLPGGERMYPESDIQTEVLDEEFIDSIELPKTLEEKTKEFEKIMPKELALQLVESRFTGLFERLYEKYPSDPVVIATTLLSTMKDMKRKGFDIDKIKEDDLENIFAALHSNKIAKKSVRQILEKISIGEDVKNAVESMRLISSEDLEKIVYNVVKKNPGLSEKALAGLVMESAKGRADGENVLMVIKKTMQKRN